MRIFILAVLVQWIVPCQAQKLPNEFFVFHNIISGDNTHKSYDSQVSLVKANGFDGIEIGSEESFEEMIAAIDNNKFKCSSFYVKLKVEDKYIDPALQSAIKKLKDMGTVISPHIVRGTPSPGGPTSAEDAAIVELLKELSTLCAEFGLQIALYPHWNFYMETTSHALDLVKKVNRKNVGLGFNLCHWLATTNEQQRVDLYPHLRTLRPHLKIMSVNGANNVISMKQTIWDDYILPLGQGSFDTKALVEFMTGELGYRGPIGIQAFNIKGDRTALLQSTADAVLLLRNGK
jgi:sugar phosphate isomerase/epimerase